MNKYLMKQTYIISNLSDKNSKTLTAELRNNGFSVQRKQHFGKWALLVSHHNAEWITWLCLKLSATAFSKT
jgi:hypothetical protein